MEYTKGEWDAFKWIDKHGYNIFSDRGFIASVPLGESPHTMVETEANARLIAAAPDMYEALKQCGAYLGSHTVARTGGFAYQIATKALAKAEGK